MGSWFQTLQLRMAWAHGLRQTIMAAGMCGSGLLFTYGRTGSRGRDNKYPGIPLSTHLLSFHTLPKECYHLRTRHSNREPRSTLHVQAITTPETESILQQLMFFLQDSSAPTDLLFSRSFDNWTDNGTAFWSPKEISSRLSPASSAFSLDTTILPAKVS